LLTGFSVVTYSALHHVGGFAGLQHSVPPPYASFLGIESYGGWKMFGLIVALGFSVLADPGRRSCMYSALTERGAKWSMVCAGAIVMVFSVVVGIAGMYAYHLNPNLPVPDEALLWLVMNVLPIWLAAFVVVSVTSGIFSCASSNAMSVGTFFVRHIYPLATGGKYPQRPLLATHLILVIAFIATTTVAMYTGTIVDFVKTFLPITMSGLAIIILVGRFWRRATWQGALAALVVTPIVALAVKFLPAEHQTWNNAVVPTIAGILAHIIVSSLTPPSQISFESVAAAMSREREAIEGAPVPSPLTPMKAQSV
jgi:SSS family solute:Na+ symporter